MSVVGLIMAGGEGERLELNAEKPLVQLRGKAMIRYIIEAMNELDEIEEIFVAVSPHTPETAKFVSKLDVVVLETPGEGFHPDMKRAVEEIGSKTVLVVSADLPLIRPETLEEIINRFFRSGKPSLSVFVDRETLDLDIAPEEDFMLDGKSVKPCGVNIVKGEKIVKPEIEQEDMILSKPELALNVNNKESLSLAREFLSSEDDLR